MLDIFSQDAYGVRFGWGPDEAVQLSTPDGATVIVDVLSFSTAVSVAADRGIAVYPYQWRDASAAAFALQQEAALAVGRRMVDAQSPWSLSPANLRTAPAVDRLVLPSPNGSAIAAGAAGGTVVAGCLRNATAVATWLLRNGFGTVARPVAVIAAGEKWPDGGLRPGLEDALGAGAILAALDIAANRFSPEAAAARAGFFGTRQVADAVRRCGSGIELTDSGFEADVDVAVELDESVLAPVINGGAFVAQPQIL